MASISGTSVMLITIKKNTRHMRDISLSDFLSWSSKNWSISIMKGIRTLLIKMKIRVVKYVVIAMDARPNLTSHSERRPCSGTKACNMLNGSSNVTERTRIRIKVRTRL